MNTENSEAPTAVGAICEEETFLAETVIQEEETLQPDEEVSGQEPVNLRDSGELLEDFTETSNAGGAKFVVRTTGDNQGVFASVIYNKKRVETFLCSLLLVAALIRDIMNTGWGRVLNFWDVDGNFHEYVLVAGKVGKDSDAIIAELRRQGLLITTNRNLHPKLMDYILHTEPRNNKRIRITDKTGWHGSSYYVAQDRVFGSSDEDYRYNGDLHPFAVKGTLEEWQEHIGKLCVGNPLLIFSVSMAFASPVLYLLNEENGGFNLMGTTSIGKTTALKVAASVSGKPEDYVKSWHATSDSIQLATPCQREFSRHPAQRNYALGA
jgi:putative DNA primase/helicase